MLGSRFYDRIFEKRVKLTPFLFLNRALKEINGELEMINYIKA